MRWTVHGEWSLYESEWVSLRVLDVELPDGTRFDHHAVRLPRHAAAVVAHDPERGLLLLRRHRVVTDSWGWEIPAGGIAAGETAAEAAARECLEETGWRPGPLEPLGAWYPANGLVDGRFHAFLAAGADRVGDPVDVHEAERVEWVPLDGVRALLAAGEVQDGYSLTALLLFLTRS